MRTCRKKPLNWRVPDLGVYELPAGISRKGHVRVVGIEGTVADRIVHLEWDAQEIKSGMWIYDCWPTPWKNWEGMMSRGGKGRK